MLRRHNKGVSDLRPVVFSDNTLLTSVRFTGRLSRTAEPPLVQTKRQPQPILLSVSWLPGGGSMVVGSDLKMILLPRDEDNT